MRKFIVKTYSAYCGSFSIDLYLAYMKLLTTSEAAQKLGISERRVRQLINEGKLEAHKLGRDYAIEESTLKTVKTYGKAGRPAKS